VMAIEGYSAFHQLLLMFLEEYPDLKKRTDEIIASFIENDYQRHKKNVPALGEWLPLLTVTETYKWKDVAIPYMLEMFDRNVLWTLKKHPKYANPSNATADSRLQKTFEATIVSNHLLMFHVYFLKRVARPEGIPLSQIRELLDARFGRPTYSMRDQLMRECKRIKEVQDWPTFFRKVDVPAPSEDTLLEWLDKAMENSARKHYHNPHDFTPEAIARRKLEERKAAMTEEEKMEKKKKKKSLAMDDELRMYKGLKDYL